VERWSRHDARWGSSWKLNTKNFSPLYKIHKVLKSGVKTRVGRVSRNNKIVGLTACYCIQHWPKLGTVLTACYCIQHWPKLGTVLTACYCT